MGPTQDNSHCRQLCLLSLVPPEIDQAKSLSTYNTRGLYLTDPVVNSKNQFWRWILLRCTLWPAHAQSGSGLTERSVTALRYCL